MELKRKLKGNGGFSLVELIIVIAILAIIAAIAVPNVLAQVEKSKETKDKANAKLVADAAMVYIAGADKTFPSLAKTELVDGSSEEIVKGTIANLSNIPELTSKKYGSTDKKIYIVYHSSTGKVIVQNTPGTQLYP